MRKLLTGLLIMPSLLWAAPTDELLSKLQKLESMKGQFEQMVLDQGGTHMQEAEGEFQVARGNRFYWSTAMPFEQLAVSDGSTVWVYDKDLEQVVVRPLSQDLGQTPALLFGGKPADVAEAFAISERSREGESVTYRLKPKGSDPLFDQLDALGQQTVIDFRDLMINTGIDAALFNFVPPEGTDVIQQQQ